MLWLRNVLDIVPAYSAPLVAAIQIAVRFLSTKDRVVCACGAFSDPTGHAASRAQGRTGSFVCPGLDWIAQRELARRTGLDGYA